MKTDFPFVATLVERAKGPKDMDRWMVSVDGYHTEYSKGTGLREGFTLPFGRISVSDLEDFNNPKKSRTVDPTCREVLQSLASDALCYVNARDIDDFAADYGYEKPSKAIKAWEGCRDAAKFFQSRGLSIEEYAEEHDDGEGEVSA